MKRLFALLAISISGLLSACATTPHVTVNYYLPKGRLDITATRLVRCDDKFNPLISTSVTAKPVYVADGVAQTLDLGATGHWYADTDTSVTLTEDGRLSGINASATGQGGAIVKSAVALGLAIAALDQVKTDANSTACSSISTLAGGAGKDITLNYFRSENFSAPITDANNEIGAVPEQAQLVSTLSRLVGKLCIVETRKDPAAVPPATQSPAPRAAYGGDWDNAVKLHLVQPAAYQVDVKGPGSGGEECKATLWTGIVYVPQAGTPYDLPIPKAALFGNQVFKLSLSDSGQITNIEYSKTSGASAAMDAGQAVAAAVKPNTPADTAADLKAKADVIAQQERLQQCQSDPTTCK